MLFLFTLLYITIVNGSIITRTDFLHEYEYVVQNNYSLDNVFSLTNSTNIIMQNYELVSFVSSLNKHSHSPISFVNLINKYEMKIQGFYTGLLQILYEDYDSTIIVGQYFDSINNDLHNFSEHSKSYCLDTMSAIKTLDIFDSKKSNPTNKAEEPTKKAEEPTKKAEEPTKKAEQNRGALFFASAAAFVTGDISVPVSVVADIFLSKAKTRESPLANPLEKESLENPKISYAFSRIYCINTFSLQFDFVNNELFIVGDKIGYEYFINYMTLIQSNLPSSGIMKIKNIWERLEALKHVATKLD